jgi:hypothetical protein
MLTKKKSIYECGPPKDIWDEMKSKCIYYWVEHFNNRPLYLNGKVERINRMAGHGEDWRIILQMFNDFHEDACTSTMNEETRKWIYTAKVAMGLSSNIAGSGKWTKEPIVSILNGVPKVQFTPSRNIAFGADSMIIGVNTKIKN